MTCMVCIENVTKLKYFNIFSSPTLSYEITRRMCLYEDESHAFKSQENRSIMQKYFK